MADSHTLTPAGLFPGHVMTHENISSCGLLFLMCRSAGASPQLELRWYCNYRHSPHGTPAPAHSGRGMGRRGAGRARRCYRTDSQIPVSCAAHSFTGNSSTEAEASALPSSGLRRLNSCGKARVWGGQSCAGGGETAAEAGRSPPPHPRTRGPTPCPTHCAPCCRAALSAA